MVCAKCLVLLRFALFGLFCFLGQWFELKGQTLKVLDALSGEPIPFATLYILPNGPGFTLGENGSGSIKSLSPLSRFVISSVGYKTDTFTLSNQAFQIHRLMPSDKSLNEVVVSGTLGEVQRSESTIPVETYTPQLFRKSWTPTLLDAVNMINGVQSQINCNVCAAGEIRINGMEGPYTMVVLDGLPMVSSLSAIYGLAGIPSALIKRLEVVKGPASTLFGSEAMAGLINVITRDATSAPKFSGEVSASSIGELNSEISTSWKSDRRSSLLGVQWFNYTLPKDRNADEFMDLALQNRISVFNKWNLESRSGLKSRIAWRLLGEDRWGGQVGWTPKWKGSDQLYGEWIQTRRVELMGSQDLSRAGNLRLDYAWNTHLQDSWYGINRFRADQHTFFSQFLMSGKNQNLSYTLGIPMRLIWYDDNTPATSFEQETSWILPSRTVLPGIFCQTEWQAKKTLTLLTGGRLDWHNIHGLILTPRLGMRWSIFENQSLRISGGTGYRVVNLFTEDHAALSGSREVVLTERLRPEKSWNASLHYNLFIDQGKGIGNLDVSAFYTRFSNQIVGDFLSDPNKIIYANLVGQGHTKGLSIQYDCQYPSGFRTLIGLSLLDVYRVRIKPDGSSFRESQLLAPALSSTFSVSYSLKKFSIDFTGKILSPMKMPVLPNDYRPAFSPWVPLLNAQATYSLKETVSLFGGLRNLTNFFPRYALMRPFDPFDRKIDEQNPYGYTFDTAYNYAPLVGTTAYLGLRWSLD